MSPTHKTIQRWIDDGTEHQRRLEMYRVRDERKKARASAPAGWLWAAQFYRGCGNYAAARTAISCARPLPLP